MTDEPKRAFEILIERAEKALKISNVGIFIGTMAELVPDLVAALREAVGDARQGADLSGEAAKRLRALEVENTKLHRTIKALNVVGSGTMAGLLAGIDERDALVAERDVLNESLRHQMDVVEKLAMDFSAERAALVARQDLLRQALDISVTVLVQVGWEGSSVNYPARQALNKIRDLGLGNVEQQCRVQMELAKHD